MHSGAEISFYRFMMCCLQVLKNVPSPASLEETTET